MTPLRSIVYVSSALQQFSEHELAALLVEARELNRQTYTTGVLLYSGGTFMQCFEGSDEAVKVTYERIRASRKHHGIIELVNEPIPERDFADWHMGYCRAEKSEVLALSTARWQRQAAHDAASMQVVSPGRFLLKQFWQRALR